MREPSDAGPPAGPRWRVLVIGIASGEPGQLTTDAVRAMREVEVFLAADKRSEVAELLDVRRRLCAEVIGAEVIGAEVSEAEVIGATGYRFVAVPDPERADGPYEAGVADWHRLRAEADAAVVRRELPAGGTVGYLVWGDPSLYDSTLRKVELMAAIGLALDVEVVPGLSSPTLLAAAHRIVLNRVGRPVHVTTGRRLGEDWQRAPGDLVVMLDHGDHLVRLAGIAADAQIYWGAMLGLPGERLVAGRLGDVVADIVATRAELRRRHGWVMDTYLLQRP